MDDQPICFVSRREQVLVFLDPALHIAGRKSLYDLLPPPGMLPAAVPETHPQGKVRRPIPVSLSEQTGPLARSFGESF
jgi:hypothetical protein